MNNDQIENTNTSILYKFSEIIWYLLYILQVVLVFRFLLVLLNANRGASFTNFVFSISDPFVAPFANVIPASYIGPYTFSWNILLALAVYSIIAWIIVRLLLIAKPTSISK